MFCNSLRQAPKFMTLSLGEDVTDIIPFISKSSLKTISKNFLKEVNSFSEGSIPFTKTSLYSLRI